MVSRSELRQRVSGWRAAEQRERTLRARERRLEPTEALEAAIELHELLPPETHALDALRAREVAAARAAWRVLRVRLAGRPVRTRNR